MIDSVVAYLGLVTIIFCVQLPNVQARAHGCSYKVPRIDEQVILGVHLEEAANAHARVKRNVFDNLRITPYYDTSIGLLSPDKQTFIKESLVPEAIGFWMNALMVQREHAPIRLDKKCDSGRYYVHSSNPFAFGANNNNYAEQSRSCHGACSSLTKCGEVLVPPEHLFQCRYCSSNSRLSCGVSGPPNGDGVSNTDFLLYVSALGSTRCDSVDTVAYAAHCQQEATLDRPIAGHVNLCPQSVSTQAHDAEVLTSTVKHEILHALGFSAGLYAFFRDPHTKQPLTPRNSHGRPKEFDSERGYFKWSDKVIKTVERPDWYALSGKMRHSVQVLATPRVLQQVRQHFACDLLEGAELENQGGEGTMTTHWEKRLFENEAMTGTHTQNPVYSALTLALMEDTGWYTANYSTAETLHWGRHLGCDFAMKSCADWIVRRKVSNMSVAPYCEHVKQTDTVTPTTCTDTRDALALCNLQQYTKPLPLPYQNMFTLSGVPNSQVAFYGGSVELADFCPYNQEFEWRSSTRGGNTDTSTVMDISVSNEGLAQEQQVITRRDSRCEFESNTPHGIDNGALEDYGDGSRCFEHSTQWTQRKCGWTRRFRYFGAGCYQYTCSGGRVQIWVMNNTVSYQCSYAGQHIQVRRVWQGWLHEGVLICPPCDHLCKEFEWRSSTRGGNTDTSTVMDISVSNEGLAQEQQVITRRDSRCEFESNTPHGIDNGALEDYGDGSRCFEHSTQWTQRKCGWTRRFRYFGAGCYQYTCSGGRVQIWVMNNTVSYQCSYAGQHIQVRRVWQGWLHEGVLICPPCDHLCKSCVPDNRTLSVSPSDDRVSVPCSAQTHYSCVTLLVMLLTYCLLMLPCL